MACLLFPVSLLFRALVALRRKLYRAGVLPSVALPVPVIVVGNLGVGGTGKTPLTIHLAQALRARGRRPGIVSRGYRGRAVGPLAVDSRSDPAQAGDEPVVLARRAGCPVVVGRDRAAAAAFLLASHPECDVILCDDGLQHYRLRRDVEVAVFDRRGTMNGWCLPAGPLREPVERLREVDAVVFNGTPSPPPSTFGRPVFALRLLANAFARPEAPDVPRTAAEFSGLRLHAVAGIGAPERFFAQLEGMGLDFEPHPFPDHHEYRAADLAFVGDAILTTEKDAVKLARLSLPLPLWVLPVTAEASPDLATFVLEKLDGRPPA